MADYCACVTLSLHLQNETQKRKTLKPPRLALFKMCAGALL